MGIDLPAVEPETSSEDRPPSRVEYLDYREVARLVSGRPLLTCTAYLYEGEADMDVNLLLTDEEIEERNLLLTCTAKPESDELKIVFNAVKSPYVRETVLNR